MLPKYRICLVFLDIAYLQLTTEMRKFKSCHTFEMEYCATQHIAVKSLVKHNYFQVDQNLALLDAKTQSWIYFKRFFYLNKLDITFCGAQEWDEKLFSKPSKVGFNGTNIVKHFCQQQWWQQDELPNTKKWSYNVRV